MILRTYIYDVKEENPVLASLGGDTPGTSRSYIRRLAAQRGAGGEHANKLALYLKQLLGIAVTHTDEDRVHIAGPKRNGRECAPYEESKAGGDGGGGVKEAKANAPRKEIKESQRTRHFEFPARGPPGRAAGAAGPVSGQSVDKRVVRTVLNRSEYLYAGPAFAPFLPLSPSPASRFHLQASPVSS